MCDFMHLKRLPEGRHWNSSLPEWKGSWRILSTLLRQGELCNSSSGRRGSPTIHWAVPNDLLELFSLCYCAIVEQCTKAGAQNAFYSAAVEGHQKSLRDVVVPEDSQKVESLLGLLYQLCRVQTPGQVVTDVNSWEAEA